MNEIITFSPPFFPFVLEVLALEVQYTQRPYQFGALVDLFPWQNPRDPKPTLIGLMKPLPS